MRMRPSAILLLSLSWWLAWWLACAAPLPIAPNVALAPGHAQPAVALAALLRVAGGEWCAYGWKGSHCSARGFQDTIDMCADWSAGGRLGLGPLGYNVVFGAHVGAPGLLLRPPNRKMGGEAKC